MEDYENQREALHMILHGYDSNARHLVRELSDGELDQLADASEILAKLVDEETIRRIPKRTHLSE